MRVRALALVLLAILIVVSYLTVAASGDPSNINGWFFLVSVVTGFGALIAGGIFFITATTDAVVADTAAKEEAHRLTAVKTRLIAKDPDPPNPAGDIGM